MTIPKRFWEARRTFHLRHKTNLDSSSASAGIDAWMGDGAPLLIKKGMDMNPNQTDEDEILLQLGRGRSAFHWSIGDGQGAEPADMRPREQ